MFSKIAVSLFFVAGALAGDLTISTPAALIQCQPVQVKWEGGMAPYFLAAIPGGQPSAPALKDFGSQAGNMLTWNVDLPAGTSVTMRLTDSAGNINYAQAVTIQPGSGACAGAGVAAVAPSAMDSGMMSDMMPSASMSMMSMMSAPSAAMSGSMDSMSMMSGSITSSMMSTSASASSMASGSMASGMSRSMSMSMSSMSRSSASSADARPSSASESGTANGATVENVAKSGLIGALVAAFAFAWA